MFMLVLVISEFILALCASHLPHYSIRMRIISLFSRAVVERVFTFTAFLKLKIWDRNMIALTVPLLKYSGIYRRLRSEPEILGASRTRWFDEGRSRLSTVIQTTISFWRNAHIECAVLTLLSVFKSLLLLPSLILPLPLFQSYLPPNRHTHFCTPSHLYLDLRATLVACATTGTSFCAALQTMTSLFVRGH